MICKLSEVITDIAAGPFGSNLKVECFVNDGFPIIDGANLNGFTVEDNITKFVTEEKARSLHRSIARRGDVIVTISGNVGQISYIPENSKYEEYLCSQRQFRVTFDTGRVCVPWLVYFFHSRLGQHLILQFANQVGVPALSQPLKNFRNIQIDLPDLETQKKITRILSALDQKIELNNQQNKTIEKQASVLVQKYINNEKDTVELKEIMSFDNGFAFKSKDYVDSGKYKVITIKNVQDGLIDSSSAQFVADYPRDMRDCHKLSVGDVLLSLTGNVGRVGIVFEENLLLNQRVAKVKPKDENLLPFLYFFFRKKDFKQKLEALAKGTAQLNLSPVETLNEEIAYSEQWAFELSNRLKPFFEKIVLNNQNNKTLSSIRDSLLPKLMSGETNIEKALTNG